MQNVYNLLILDESGSMGSIAEATVSSFNESVQHIKLESEKHPEQRQYVSIVIFNSHSIRRILDRAPASEAGELNQQTYQPGGMTPLLDAVGESIYHLERHLANDSEAQVLVTVLTDGLENNSREYTYDSIHQTIKRLEKGNWTFTYIGTDHDVFEQSEKMGISKANVAHFPKSAAGVQYFMDKFGRHRSKYYAALRSEPTSVKRKAFFEEE